MISYIAKSFKQYIKEWSEADLLGFNKFLIRDVLVHLFKLDNIIPIMMALILLGISIQAQESVYIFIPQSSITSFISFILIQFAIALLILLVCPFIIILIFNHIGYKLPHIISKVFLPVKLILLVITFYLCLKFAAHGTFKVHDKFLIMLLWCGLYFFLMNLYLAQKHHQNPLKLTTFRISFAIFFILIIVKPFSTILYLTSEMINYMEINPSLYLTQTNCKLISKPLNSSIQKSNLSSNYSQYFESADGGCYLNGNLIRLGFASDYIVIFKQNIQPVKDGKLSYNYYARLNCYSGSCFVENVKLDAEHDLNTQVFASVHLQ